MSGEGIFRVRPEVSATPERIIPGVTALWTIVAEDSLYWGSHRSPLVTWRPLAGGTSSSIDMGSGTVGGFAVDSAYFYALSWGNTADTSTVYRLPRAGGSPIRFSEVPSRGGQSLLRSRSGDIFVGTQYNPNIWRIPAGGAIPEVFVTLAASYGAIGQFAEDERYLYVTAGSESVLRIDRMTRAVEVVATDPDDNIPFGLVVTDTMIYYTRHFANDVWAMRK